MPSNALAIVEVAATNPAALLREGTLLRIADADANSHRRHAA